MLYIILVGVAGDMVLGRYGRVINFNNRWWHMWRLVQISMRQLPGFPGRSTNHCIRNRRGRSKTPKFVTLLASIERASFPIFYAPWNHWNQCHFPQLKAFRQVLLTRSLLSILARRLTLMCVYSAKMASKDAYISSYKANKPSTDSHISNYKANMATTNVHISRYTAKLDHKQNEISYKLVRERLSVA